MSFLRRAFHRVAMGPYPSLRGTIGGVISVYCTGQLFMYYLYDWSLSHGPSMYPTITPEVSFTLYSRLHRQGRNIQLGDIVHSEHPFFTRKPVGKRVVGMPGDYVVRDPAMAATVGGAPIPGLSMDGEEDDREEPMMVQVPEGHVWLAGDNLAWSRDSRFYGPVPMALIRGKALADADGLFTWKWLGGNHLVSVDGKTGPQKGED